jgi:hypothetical protein
MKIDYAKHPDTDIQALEEGLAALGRVKDLPWLVEQIEGLGEARILGRFIEWPGAVGPEGQWGALFIDPYWIMCQLLMPPKHERALGVEALLKIDRAGTREQIRERLRELG